MEADNFHVDFFSCMMRWWENWGARLTVSCSSVTLREVTCCCLQWWGKWSRLSLALARLLSDERACSQGHGRVLKRQQKHARPLGASAWEWHNVIFALSYWPKQVTCQPIFRSAEMDDFFMGWIMQLVAKDLHKERGEELPFLQSAVTTKQYVLF